MTSTDQRVLKTRETVLNAALELFFEKGISSVTHLNIAAATGVGRKTVYRHWPTTDDLLADALSRASFPPSPDSDDLRSNLIEHLKALRDALQDGPLAYILHALNERAHVEPKLRDLRNRLTRDGCSGLVTLLETSVRKGEMRGDLDLDIAASTLEGPIFYFALVRHMPVQDETILQIVDDFLTRHTVGGF